MILQQLIEVGNLHINDRLLDVNSVVTQVMMSHLSVPRGIESFVSAFLAVSAFNFLFLFEYVTFR